MSSACHAWTKLGMQSICGSPNGIKTFITEINLPVSDWVENGLRLIFLHCGTLILRIPHFVIYGNYLAFTWCIYLLEMAGNLTIRAITCDFSS